MRSSQPIYGCAVFLIVVAPLLVLPVSLTGQVPPARLEVHVTPAIEGLTVEVLGTDLVRRTDGEGIAVLPVPPGLIEIEVRAPTGESTRKPVHLRPEGQIEAIDFSEISRQTPPETSTDLDRQSEDPETGSQPVDPPPGSTETELPDGGASPEAPAEEESRSGTPDPAPLDEAPTSSRGPLIFLTLVLVMLPLGAGFVVIRRRRSAESPDAPTQIWAPLAGVRAGDRVGERLAEFDLEEVIGRGGMATVWRASADGGEPIALKVMNPDLAEDPVLRKKFLREGAVLEKIQANWPEAPIVRIRNWGPRPGADASGGESDATPWVALEYLEGPTLLQHIRNSPQPFDMRGILQFAGQVAVGLRAAHDCGVYHRDLTPDNILLLSTEEEDPIIRLIDFGVARHEFTQVHTLDGSIFGKPPYMAPEQGEGLAVDGRADLYSLGIILYLLLTGQTPFSDTNPLMVLQMHSSMPPPPLPGHLPAGVIELVEALLEKDPQDRVPDADTLLHRIRGLASLDVVSAPPLP